MTFELEPKGKGVLLTVIHRRLPDRSTMLKVSAGWHMHLDVLVARASGEEPAPFWDGWSRLQQGIRPAAAGLSGSRAHAATSIATNRRLAMKTNVVSAQEWEAARQQMLVKEKDVTRARDALAAERRRMPWMAVEKTYEFEGPEGKASLLDLFEGRRQLIVYRAFFEPGVFGWPEHACRGCSLVADQVAHLAHLNARDTTLVFASRAPQADIARLKARMGWEMIPWYTITDSFDADFGVDEWHGTNVFFRDGEQDFPHLLHQQPRRRGDGEHLELPRHHAARPSGGVGGLARRLSADPTYKWWNWHDSYVADAAPDQKWVEVSDAGEAAFRKEAGAKP